MPLIIQKYGGTSLIEASSREIVAKKVTAARAQGEKVVLVISAIGRRGYPYATDTLLDLLTQYEGGADPLTSDLIASCGEIISCCVISSLLNSKGIMAIPMSAYSAGIEVEGPFGDATPVRIDSSRINRILDDGIVPVIAGFQGIDNYGRIYTLGRGGSDTTAVALGIALHADYVDIYKDVPGVAKADPHVILNAQFMSFLDYDSMFRLANHGARVLHDKSAILAKDSGIKIRIRSTFDDSKGTLIAEPEDGYKVPHFIGLTTNTMSDGRLKVTAVMARGESREEEAKIAWLIETSGFSAVSIDCDDQDAFAFACDPSDGKRFAIALYSLLS
ncbi:MAG TPA: hypothetical protein PK105_08045 [Rectinema sp.]|nr:hypothetical protein [Rectinema sp.]